jgi:hypothetical protein
VACQKIGNNTFCPLFIFIFPNNHNSIRRQVENRAEKAEKLKRFAIGQFHNEFTLESDKLQKEKNLKILRNVQKVQVKMFFLILDERIAIMRL